MIRLRFVVVAASLLALSVAAACGGTTTTPAKADPTGVIDPDAGMTLDAGPDGTLPPDPLDMTYPTMHTAIPQADFNGGKILKNPKLVTITFNTGAADDAGMAPPDTMADMLEQFGDTITVSKWWDAVRDGYCDDKGNCVGQGTGGGHVRLASTDHVASYTDTAASGGPSTIQDFIKSHIADGSFPAPDADTLYMIYFPGSVSVTLDNSQSCSSFLAYHNSVTVTAPADDAGVPAPVDVAYAIMPRCRNNLADVTVSASHELAEAATDPHVDSPAYYMMNQIWATLGGEVGDLCQSYQGNDTYLEGPFTVQRSWSNKAAAASHNPCVPAPDGPYFNVSPPNAADALAIKVGAQKTIQLTAFSDAPMADWSLDVQEYTRFQGGSNVLTLALDRTTVHNGSKPNLTITLTARPTNGLAYFALISSTGGTTHTWPMAVRAN